jgi:Rrf2 family protein
MRLSKKGEYAIRALVEIGVQSRQIDSPLLQISTIAKKTKIPEKFLEQILLALKNGGILKSKRGIDGGYTLNKPTNAIFLGEIVRLLDGPLAPIPCVSKTAYEPCTCPDEASCGLRLAMLQVRNAIAEILDNYSLERVVSEVDKAQSRHAEGFQFDI